MKKKQNPHILHRQNVHPLEDLISVMRALRSPDTGCPWDLEQNFQTIAPYTIEEAYEVADAIARDDMQNLREELGDLLLQSIYHAQIASEKKLFDIYDVIRDITQKMISRHPHVFGDEKAKTASDVNKIWDHKKSQEKTNPISVLDDVPLALPAIMRAEKLQKRAAKTGFEWTSTEEVLDKLEEEIAEIRLALKNNDSMNIAEELGDILFVLVNLGRVNSIDTEEALRNANRKFERRFRAMEKASKTDGLSMNDMSLQELIDLWKKQKAKE